MVSKYGHLMLGAFLKKVNPDLDFINEAFVQSDAPVVQILL